MQVDPSPPHTHGLSSILARKQCFRLRSLSPSLRSQPVGDHAMKLRVSRTQYAAMVAVQIASMLVIAGGPSWAGPWALGVFLLCGLLRPFMAVIRLCNLGYSAWWVLGVLLCGPIGDLCLLLEKPADEALPDLPKGAELLEPEQLDEALPDLPRGAELLRAGGDGILLARKPPRSQ